MCTAYEKVIRGESETVFQMLFLGALSILIISTKSDLEFVDG